ncbi:MAG: ATP-binding cassette domain-containing protein [Betaproteobacteria bacterium]
MNLVPTIDTSPEIPQATLPGMYRAVWRHAIGMRGRYIAAMALLTLSQVVKLAIPWLAAKAIDTLMGTANAGPWHPALLAAGIFGVFALAWAMHGPGRILERQVGLRVRASVSDALYAKLANLPLAWHEARHSGETQHRAHQASGALYEFTQNQFVYLQNFVNLVGPLIALTMLSLLTGGLALLGYVVIAVVVLRFDVVLMRLATQENDAERRYAAGLLDFLGNISTIVSLRLQAASRGVVASRLLDVFKPLRRNIAITEAKWCAVDLLTAALSWGLVGLFAWQAHRSIADGSALLLGGIFMVYQYSQQAGGVIGGMAANFQAFARMRTDFASAEPIWQAVERPQPTVTVAPDWQEIEAHGLEFVYVRSDGERGGVQGATLTLRRGERVALIGPSGSGKSTLLRLMAGLYDPQHGFYRIDGETRFGLRHLGSVATLVPQEAEVFEASVRDNLTFAVDRPQAHIDEAARMSCFDVVADSMPLGLDTLISERGFNLSGGQRQRLALARGLLAARDSSLVFLDEPTSALDQITEARVFQRLREGLPDACIVASVHRMSALAHFDKVVLLDEGRVVDCGTVAELQRQPLFREMLHGDEAEEALPVAV